MFRVAFCISRSDHARATHSALYFDLIYSRVCGQFCFCLPMVIAKLQRLAHDQPCTCTWWNRSRESKALLVFRYVEPVEGVLLGDLPRYMVESKSSVPVY